MSIVYIVVAVVAGVLFFRLRGTHPLPYGIIEVGAAIASLSFAFYPPYEFITTDRVSPIGSVVQPYLGILFGIYILVRGLDNIDRGLPVHWRDSWDKWFPKQPNHCE
jgi:hypothetical protein